MGIEGALFRPEVMQAKSADWLGTIRIARPPDFAWVTGIAVLLGAALLAYGVLGQVSRKERLPGLVVPQGGLLQVAAPQAGTVAEVLVHEGDWVKAGQVLVRVQTPRTLSSGGEAALLAEQALAQRRAGLEAERRITEQQAQARRLALQDRLRSLVAEQRQAQGELEASQLRVKLAQKNLERYAELAKGGFVAPVQAQSKEEDLLDIQLRERNAQRGLEGLARDIRSAESDLQAATLDEQASLSQLDRAMAQLSQERVEEEARDGLAITAPQAGIVTALLALHAGQAVTPGQALVSMAPQDAPGSAPLQAQLYAPSRTVGFVAPGQAVWLRLAAFPYQKFGMLAGVVTTVSQSPLAPQDLPAGDAQSLLAASGSQGPLYRVNVRLDAQSINAFGQAQALKPGMALDADVVQEKRRVWEWLFEPALAVLRARA